MKKIYFTILISLAFSLAAFSQTTLLSTSFEGPGFDKDWTMGVSQGINLEPQDYPATGLDPWEKWDITETTGFGYVHSGDSAAWIGGTLYDVPTHDWLMTPLITIPEDGETVLYYWLWYHSEAMYVNRFYIMIYDNEDGNWKQAYLRADEFNSPLHYTEEYKLSLNEWRGRDIKIAFVKNGTYQMAMDDIRVVTNNPNAIIEEKNIAAMLVYPNPADNIVKVELGDVSCDNVLTITDITGKTIISETVTDNSIEINISSLSSGLYFIKHGNKVCKFAVK
jgi:hypothetical protein